MKSATITLTVAQGRLTGAEYVFENPTQCVVGRASECDIHLTRDYGHTDVSRHHCALEINPPEIRVRDLGSRNGTFVNGEKIGNRISLAPLNKDYMAESSARELHDGDEIKVGDYVLRVGVQVGDLQHNGYARAR